MKNICKIMALLLAISCLSSDAYYRYGRRRVKQTGPAMAPARAKRSGGVERVKPIGQKVPQKRTHRQKIGGLGKARI